MPHVKFAGDLDLETVWQAPPTCRFSVPEQELHIKYLESFLNRERDALLLRFIVVEGRLTQNVQVLLSTDDPGWILKLDRTYPILRTDGVKLLLATIAAWIEAQGPAKTSSNLEPYEARGRFYAMHNKMNLGE